MAKKTLSLLSRVTKSCGYSAAIIAVVIPIGERRAGSKTEDVVP